jgi:hypothetical protein
VMPREPEEERNQDNIIEPEEEVLRYLMRPRRLDELNDEELEAWSEQNIEYI